MTGATAIPVPRLGSGRGAGVPEVEKEYQGERGNNGCRVFVVRGAQRAPLRHHVRHSPDGFEWGFGGSGPAELARCILIDHYGLHDHVEMDEAQPLPVDYMAFKHEVIARLPRKRWSLTESRVAAWAATWELGNS